MNSPSMDEQFAAKLRAIAQSAIVEKYGPDRAGWPAVVVERMARLDAEQAKYESEFPAFVSPVMPESQALAASVYKRCASF